MGWRPKVIYSIGVRCTTEICLRQLNLRRFSSIFGSLNCKTPSNIEEFLLHDFKYFFDFEKHIYSKYTPSMRELTQNYGYRTLLEDFDDITNFHDATVPHHDLSCINALMHFKRGINRLKLIEKNKIPTLFIYSSNTIEDSHHEAFQVPNVLKLFKTLHRTYNCSTLALFSKKISNPKVDNLIQLVKQVEKYSQKTMQVFSHEINSTEDITPALNKLMRLYDIGDLMTIKQIDSI